MFVGSLLAEHQRIGQIITAELSFRNLRALLLSLYIERHGKDEDYAKLKELMNEAGKAAKKRNEIVHSIWGAGKSKDHITRIKTTAKENKGLDFKFEEIDADKLEEISVLIRDCASQVKDLESELITKGKLINNPVKKQWGTSSP